MGVPCELEPAQNPPKPGDCFCVCGDNMTYIQPKPPESKRPRVSYVPSKEPFDSVSIYKVSYRPFPLDDLLSAKSPSAKPEPATKRINERMDGITTFRTSYLKPFCEGPCLPAKPFLPGRSQLALRGPMDSLTTHKVDFVAKPYSKRNLVEFDSKLTRAGAPMECHTTFRVSYGNPFPYERAELKVPVAEKILSDEKLDGTTTYKLSYIPHKPTGHENPPWARATAFKPSGAGMEKLTTYYARYRPVTVPVHSKRDCSP